MSDEAKAGGYRFSTISFEERLNLFKNIPEVDEVIVQNEMLYDNILRKSNLIM